jgi:MFS family permease
LARLANSVRIFGALTRNRNLLRVQLAFLGFNAVEYGTWIAILLYAYEATGPTSVGVVALAQLVPAAVFAPIAASLGDRMRRDRFLLVGYVVQTLTMGMVTVAMALELEPLLVYGLACVEAATLTMTRPAQGALLPSLAETPEELTAANGFSAVAEGAGVLLGPLGAAVILAVSAPSTVFIAGTVVLAVAALLAATVRLGAVEIATAAEVEIATAAEEEPTVSAMEGFRLLARQRDARLLVGLLSSRMILIGALDVLFVLMALELFDTGESGAGILNAALGAGGMIGGVITLGLVGRRQLGPALVLGSLSFGACVVAIGLVPSQAAAPMLIVVSAVGLSLMDATGRTLLQRVVSDESLARVFGVLEGLAMAALGLGSIVVPALVAWLGLEGTIVALGALLPALALLAIPGLRRIDASVVVPERELALLGTVAMFAPLRPQVLESVARRASWVTAPAGTVLIAEGEPGDRYYVLASGRLEATQDGQHLRTMREPGDGVGEIALLFDVPRTATVTVAEDAELLALERVDFLTALTGHPEVARAAHRVADERLSG